MKPIRLHAGLAAYGGAVLLLSQIGQPALDAIAGIVAAGSSAVAAATQAAVVAVIQALGRPETVLAVLGPLTFVALTAVVGVIVWPATIDHVPNDDAADEPRQATVTDLTSRRSDIRRSAA